MSQPITRRTFVVSATAATALIGCDLLPTGGEPTGTADTGGSYTEPITTPPASAGSDGNVVRDFVDLDGVPVPVAWRAAGGDTRLSVEGHELVLISPFDGVRRVSGMDLDFGAGGDSIGRRLGPSVLAEARQSLAILTAQG